MSKRYIRTSAKALITRDGKILLEKKEGPNGLYYCLPGGGQELDELLPATVEREVAEEIGVRVAVRDIAFVIEGLEGEEYHRIDVVFLCDYLGETGAPTLPDTTQIGADWVEIDTLYAVPLFPVKLRRAIRNLCQGRPQNVYLGNENAGGPIVDVLKLETGTKLWRRFSEYADSCSQQAREQMAQVILHNGFSGREALFAALHRDKIVGFGALVKSPRIEPSCTPCIVALYVEEPYRGRGLGGLLVDHMCGYARSQGYAETYLLGPAGFGAERFGFTFVQKATVPGGLEEIYVKKL